MPLVYFDTDCFHHFATTFQDKPLAQELRGKLLFSPITMMEVFSHLARSWGGGVHKQLLGMHNWIVTDHAQVLPWMDDAIARIGFGATLLQDDHVKSLQANLNACINSELPDLLVVAKTRDEELQQIKNQYAKHFQSTIEFCRENPLTEDVFTDMWLTGLANRIGISVVPKMIPEVVQTLGALHEFEFCKLMVASNQNREIVTKRTHPQTIDESFVGRRTNRVYPERDYGLTLQEQCQIV